MKINIKKFIIVLFIITSIISVGTIGYLFIRDDKDKNQQITLNYSSLTISIDESVELIATITPNYKNQEIIWLSSDNNIVTVDNGIITGKKVGTALIYAKTNTGLSTTCEINVQYAISYELNGGSIEGVNLTKYNETTNEIILINPIKKGYKFTGWTGTDLHEKTIEVKIPTGSSGNRSYTANWEIVKYKISYNLNGGINNEENLIEYTIENDNIVLLNPTRDYYNFVEWQFNGSKITEIKGGSSENITLTAIWIEKEYNISYNLNDGVLNGFNPVKYTVNSNEIIISNPSKKGYKFTGWTGTDLNESTMEVVISTGSFGNRSYIANWEIITYTISYELNYGINNSHNLDKYTIETESVILQNPTRDYYDFVEWQSNGEKITEIKKGSTGNLTITAIWNKKIFNINYELNGGLVNGFNPNTYDIETKEIHLVNPIKKGYKFIGWTGTDLNENTMNVVIPTRSNGNRLYIANWEIEKYTISYILDNGINNINNPTQYTIETDTIELQNPTKEHYDFIEWQLNNDTINKIEKGLTGNIELIAIWREKDYTITYNLNNGLVDSINPFSYNINSKEIKLNNPTRIGYEFIGWTGTGLTEKTMNVIIPTGSYGNRTFMANWKIIEYSIIYNLDGGINNIYNPVTYTIESDTILLQNPTKECYEFIEWQFNGNKCIQIEKGSIGDIVLDAVWNNSEYIISYNLNNGFLNISNPTIYNINSNSITLNNPTRVGYNFVGWTGTGLLEKTMVVTIPTGSYGNRTYTANWETIKYKIKYNLNNGINNSQNPEFYTIETESIELKNPTREHYDFVEWQFNGNKISNIENNLLKDIEIEAVWKEKEYLITYNLNNGIVNGNLVTYNINSSSITLNNPTRVGYEFVGWTGTDLIEKTMNVIIPTRSYGNRTYTANWKVIEYTINYEPNGGIISGNNYTLYSIESESIVLINPTKIGYKFVGWTGTDLIEKTMNVTIPTGSYGNRTYTANWEIIRYKIIYELNGGSNNKLNPTEYTIETDTITLFNPTKDFYEFVEWKSNGLPISNIFKGSTENITLLAVWKEIDYTITYNLNDGSVSSENPTVYNVNSFELVINNPIKLGYNFIGWTGTDLTEKTMNVTIPTGSNGNRIYTANWEIITYTINYTLDGGNFSDNPTQYNINSSNIIINNPERKGYEFIGWSGNDLNELTMNLVIINGSVGNRTYKANWKIIEYTITYNLNNGINNSNNPSKYTIENETIVLYNPTKDYYNFVEWHFNGNKITQIETDITSNIEIEAIWIEEEFEINYNLNGGIIESNNQTNYNINSPSIKLYNPTRKGYNFIGWTGTDLVENTLEVIISTGSVGDRSYYANWEIITYTITYELNGGINHEDNPVEYTIETDTIILQNPIKEYFEFKEWQINGEKITQIQKGTTGNIELEVIWEGNNFSIQYELNNGENSLNNPVIYNINSNDIILEKPTRKGYNFIGWTGTDLIENTLEVVISTGSVGDRIYYANWEIITYTITYELNGGINHEDNPVEYTIETDTIILQNPTKKYVEFIEWQFNGDKINQIEKGTIGNLTLIAIWDIASELSNFEYYFDNEENLIITGLIDKSVSEIKVPDYIYKIEEGAFAGTSNLISIELPFIGEKIDLTSANKNTLFGYIFGLNEYEGSTKTVQYYSSSNSLNYYIPSTLKNVKITKGSIFNRAFYNCSTLENIILNDSVESIPYRAFYNCSNLVNFKIPCNVKIIDEYAFYNCINLTEITIENSVTDINEGAFYNCSSLKEINIPNSVTFIDKNVLFDCSSIESISVPFIGDSVDSLKEQYKTIGYVFGHRSDSLDNSAWVKQISITYKSNIQVGDTIRYETVNYYLPKVLKKIQVTGGEICDDAFNGCTNVEEIQIPNNIISIGKNAFRNCEKITNIIIPSEVVNIGNAAYLGTSLISVILPKNLESIGSSAFSCKKLVELYNLSKLNITLENQSQFGFSLNTLKVIHTSFEEHSNILISNGIIYYVDDTNKIALALENTNILEVVLDDDCNQLYDYVFENSSIISIYIPNSIKVISNYAFHNCINLKSALFGENSQLISIGNAAFYGCISVENINLPENLEKIESSAFASSGLISITIPNSVSYIGKYAFLTTSLVSVYVENDSTWKTTLKGGYRNVDGAIIKYNINYVYKITLTDDHKSNALKFNSDSINTIKIGTTDIGYEPIYYDLKYSECEWIKI